MVRADVDLNDRADDASRTSSRRRARLLRLGTTAALVGVAGAHALGTSPSRATADGSADTDLFALTNQDRASNGVAALQYHTTLAGIGESRPYSGCGFTVDGRAYDMIQRSYFSHPILNCGGQYVFNMMQADGVGYRSAGENIGWSSNSGDASGSASYINGAFMNSPEHRANILNGSYTHVGMGSDGPVGSWSGAGGPYPNVWMFSEEFAQLGATAPPPPPPAPSPTRAPTPAPTPVRTAAPQPTPLPPPPPRNEPAPPLPSLIPAEQTAAPTPAPTPTPALTQTPAPAELAVPGATAGVAAATSPPLIWTPSGLLGDSIEAVLEGYLLD